MNISQITGSAGRLFNKKFITVDQALRVFERMDPRNAARAMRIVERLKAAQHTVKRIGELSLIALAKCREQSRSAGARRRRRENEAGASRGSLMDETARGLHAFSNLHQALVEGAAFC